MGYKDRLKKRMLKLERKLLMQNQNIAAILNEVSDIKRSYTVQRKSWLQKLKGGK